MSYFIGVSEFRVGTSVSHFRILAFMYLKKAYIILGNLIFEAAEIRPLLEGPQNPEFQNFKPKPPGSLNPKAQTSTAKALFAPKPRAFVGRPLPSGPALHAAWMGEF